MTFPFAYMLGDVITELWGFRISKKIIWITFLCNIVLVVCTQIGIWLPSPEHLSATASAYNEVFTYVPRIVIASLVGFLLGELSNAWIMEKIKIRMKGRRMWVRTIGSSAIGYVFDTLPFVLIAFLGTVTTRELLLMMALQYASKLLIESVFGTPMAYATVHLIRKYNR
ncbi:MAG: queuosine precursor transporter [Candidatus Paraprevotella stercoravium]|uniref:Queuosine precursor transporter n=1 Tax=Candidatus Paraprevotella stercoravium TaxID=2838725 RepID=A0A9E2LA77_9BACT|nr:queuosine precursor transporter [Candidatus Paraprevotella stercoravium]